MGRRLALLIGNANFQDSDNFPDLRTPAENVRKFANLIEQYGDFEILDALIDGSYEEIRQKINDLYTSAKWGDLTLLYYVGHGYKPRASRYYLVANNTQKERLAATGIRETYIHDLMHDSGSRHHIVILDCCYSGAFLPGRMASGQEPLLLEKLEGEATAILTSSGKSQESFEEEGDYSLFTKHLMLGIETGQADKDEDGYISVNELYDYVDQNVRKHRSDQTPMLNLQRRRNNVTPILTRNPKLSSPNVLPNIIESQPPAPIPKWMWYTLGITIGIALIAVGIAGAAAFLNLRSTADNVTSTPTHTITPTRLAVAVVEENTPSPSPALTNTPTSVPSETPRPTPIPTFTSVPEVSQTPSPTRRRGTSTPPPPSPKLTITPALSASNSTPPPPPTETLTPTPTPPAVPVLLAPKGGTPVWSNQITIFQWQWNGILPTGQGFDILVWQSDEPDQPGAFNATEIAKDLSQPGENTYQFSGKLEGASSVVLNGTGPYSWTVTIVNLETEDQSYSRVGPAATPYPLNINVPGSASSPGGGPVEATPPGN